jgi:hypothetical protein
MISLQQYLEKIFSTYSPDELSYFEMNLETWRQLWRVLEMSDIILMIVDIRYPVSLDTCIYTIVDLFCANEFFRAISHWKWSPRCEMRWEVHFEHNIHVSMIVCLSNNSYKPITNTAWVHARLCKLQKGCTRLAATYDKVYQLLVHGWWFSPGTPASSTIKTGRHDIAEILLKVALKHQKSKSNLVKSI